MQFIYRGIPYEREPLALDKVETQRQGTYRGRAFNFSYPRHIPVPQPALNLQYRGLLYQKTASGQIQPAFPNVPLQPQPTPKAAELPKPSPYVAHRAVMRELGRVHQQNIERLLQHRLAVAKAKGDERLVAQLEQEMHQHA
ncbi:MAG: DUF4278 domain-containing protein [Synechococcales bacterium]|nr:DUF4278 domain-containing protein [Synechococcales bacterium]